MELSRQEYPALLIALQPNQAVTVVNDRVKLIAQVNIDIADWLHERRIIEIEYVKSLRRLASRKQDNYPLLGVFQQPWQSVVASLEILAESHANFAHRVDSDVEKPLREFAAKNREMQGISTIQGNLLAMAKELEEAQKKAGKLEAKGGKADSSKVTSAMSSVQEATSQWESQAPFVFEQLQALDESRVNQLRDFLTQYLTHENDRLDQSQRSVAKALNALLNVSTQEEISSFVARTSNSAPTITTRRDNRPSTSGARQRSELSNSYTPSAPSFTSTPRLTTDSADRSAPAQTPTAPARSTAAPPTPSEKKGGFRGLKRLGTVMRRKEPKVPDRAPSPDKKEKSKRGPLRRGSSFGQMPSRSLGASTTDLPSTQQPTPQIPRLPQPTSLEMPATNPPLTSDQPPLEPLKLGITSPGIEAANGRLAEISAQPSPPLTNGSQSTAPIMEERRTRPPRTILEEVSNSPSSAVDAISQAEQQAAAENDSSRFRLNIHDRAIQEEEPGAEEAMSNVSNTLRASMLPPPRKPGTVRGRRDVRNTMFVPNAIDNAAMPGASPTMGVDRSPSLPAETDTQSIRSAHSLSSVAPVGFRHPELHSPGLNASIVETVSATFSGGQVTKSTVIGELAMAYNGSDTSRSERIRLENFPVLEKVAPNPSFINQTSKAGEYSVDLSQISRTTVGFKYQLHLDDSSLASHAPVILNPAWKVEPNQISVILNYSFNPSSKNSQSQVSLQNVVVSINISGATARSCMSKPAGTFSKDKNMIYWRLGDLNLDDASGSSQKLLARFQTEGEAKPGGVEARWEIGGEYAAALGSGLGVSRLGSAAEAADPFAGEGVGSPAAQSGAYSEVPVARKLVSGRYVAQP